MFWERSFSIFYWRAIYVHQKTDFTDLSRAFLNQFFTTVSNNFKVIPNYKHNTPWTHKTLRKMSRQSMYLLHVVVLLGLRFFRWAILDPYGSIYIAPLKSALCRNPLELIELLWKKNLIPLKAMGILPLTLLKPGFFTLYICSSKNWAL